MRQIKIHRKKRTMYGSKPVQLDGFTFDSEKEAKHYLVLKQRQEAGEISDLELQKRWVLQEAFRDKKGVFHKAITYLSDFSYTENGRKVVVDVKSKGTIRDDVFAIKKKMFIKRYENEYDFKVVL